DSGHLLRPQLLALVGVDANDHALLGRRAEQEDLALDDDGRRVPRTDERRLEQDVVVAPLDGHVLVGGVAGTVGSAEARPVGGGENGQSGSDEKDASVHGRKSPNKGGIATGKL